MDILTNLQMKAAAFKMHMSQGFPLNPKDGQLTCVNGALYCYVNIKGYLQWLPLTKKRNIFVFNQDVESDSWIINHSLNTTEFIYSIYNFNGMLQLSSATIIDSNTVQIDLTQPTGGKAVLISSIDEYNGFKTVTSCSVNGNISYGTEDLDTTDNLLYFKLEV